MGAKSVRLEDYGNSLTVWVSATYTDEWVRRWPCATLIGRRIRASFDTGGLVDIAFNGGSVSPSYFDSNEVNACLADAIESTGKIDDEHPCYCVAVGQFK